MSQVDQPLFPKKESTACGPRPPPCFVVWLHIYFQVKFSFKWTGPNSPSSTNTKKQREYPWITSYELIYNVNIWLETKIMSSQNISCLISAISAVNQNQPNYEKLAPLRSVPSVPNVWHLPPCEEITGGCHVQQVFFVCFSPKKN